MPSPQKAAQELADQYRDELQLAKNDIASLQRELNSQAQEHQVERSRWAEEKIALMRAMNSLRRQGLS